MISVIIPLYNKEPIIERSLQSVLSQDYDDFEVVVVNDGSTDRSADIVRSINDPRIRLIEQENGGPSKARNTGTKNARGEWIVFLDADDELLPGALRIFYRLSVEHSDADIIDCCMKTRLNNTIIDKQYSFTGYCRNPLRALFFDYIEPGSNETLFKKEVCVNNPYNEEFRRYEDVEFSLRVLKNSVVYSSCENVAIVNIEYSSASHAKKSISSDFIGHLSLSGTFWQKMIKYKLYIYERNNYKEECRRLYPKLRYRYDMLILLKMISSKYVKKMHLW